MWDAVPVRGYFSLPAEVVLRNGAILWHEMAPFSEKKGAIT